MEAVLGNVQHMCCVRAVSDLWYTDVRTSSASPLTRGQINHLLSKIK